MRYRKICPECGIGFSCEGECGNKVKAEGESSCFCGYCIQKRLYIINSNAEKCRTRFLTWRTTFHKVRNKSLKGYRIRVTIDIPIWDTSKKHAMDEVERKINKCISAKIMKIKCVRKGLPDNKDLFPEEWNPSKVEKDGQEETK